MFKFLGVSLFSVGLVVAMPAFAKDPHGGHGNDQDRHDNGKHGRPHTPPPSAKWVREVRPANPYHNGVWTPGYYVWQPERDHYSWRSGMWVQPPQPQAQWTPARWQLQTGEWTLTIGHW